MDWSSLNAPRVTEVGDVSQYAVPEVPLETKRSSGTPQAAMGERPKTMPFADYLIAAAIGVAAFVSIVLTWNGYGHSWDEAYYYQPARLAQDWMRDMVVSDKKPVGSEDIQKYWSEIKELPSLPKFAWASGLSLFEWLLGPSNAMRVPVALAFGLLLMLVYRFAHCFGGRAGAVAAALLMAGMPRAWAEAHFAVAETFAALMFLLTVYCYWRAMFSARWAIVCGLVFGLALDTKIQAVLLPLVLFFWGHLYARPRHANAMLSMLFLAPVVWIASWPWLWHDPVGRVLEFLQFYSNHQYTAVYYFGRKWNFDSTLCPWHYPWVLTAITIPPPALMACIIGGLMALRHLRSRPAPVLIAACALFPIAFNSLPSQAKYDGTRLFGWAYPFFANLGEIGRAHV
jgi:4-amino-4-deoxy-L-arabinose transferase-like glycosyltransferase